MKLPKSHKLINSFTLKIVAVLFALFLWFYVDAQLNPLADQRFDVAVSYENLPEGLTYSGGVKSVTVTVKGRQDRMSSLRSSDFSARVDLSAVTVGDNQLEVTVSAPEGVETFTVRPNKFTVTVERITEINLEVQATVLGAAKDGYTRFAPTVTPSSILVQGPESLLASIASAKVEIDATGASSNLVLELPVKLLTKDGLIVDKSAVAVKPDTVEVFLPVDQDTPSKMVAVKPNLVGQPAAGYTISRVVTEPATVKIAGRFNDIDQVDQLLTMPITISNITEDLVQEAELKLPDGVTLMSGKSVRVLVSLSRSAVQKTVELPIAIRGETELAVQLDQTTAQVTLEGTAEELEDAERLARIVPFVTVSGLEAGTHTLELGLEDDSGLQVVQVLPASVEATLTAKESQNAETEQ